MILPLGDPASFSLFALTAIAITLALVPVGLTTSDAPQPLREVRLRLGASTRCRRSAWSAGFFVGLANGAFGGLGVVFAQDVGLSITGVALFMSAALVGGALAQLPLGRLSDRTDRRKVIIAVCALAALVGGVLALLGEARPSGQLPRGSAAASPVLAVAARRRGGGVRGRDLLAVLAVRRPHQRLRRARGVRRGEQRAAPDLGDRRVDRPGARGGRDRWLGAGGLFAYTALVHAAFALFTVYRMPAGRPSRPRSGRPTSPRPAVAAPPRSWSSSTRAPRTACR